VAAVRSALALLAAAALLAGCGGDGDASAGPPPDRPPATTPGPAPSVQDAADPSAQAAQREQRRRERPVRASGGPRVSTLARGLRVPWEIAFLPDGRALITERGGTVRLLDEDGVRDRPLRRIPVQAVGEGGLLGLAVDPDFAENRLVYAYRTTAEGNEVLRLRFARGALRPQRVVLRGIRAAAIHDGGRLRFGPDERLYVTTGDAAEPALAQADGRNGKVLRLTPRQYRGAGGTPEVFTTGHRNVQGLAWQPGSGRLLASEHGPDGDDEINVLRRGANYGWPEVRGERHGAFRAPIAVYAQSIAPSGATFVTRGASAWTGDLLVSALRGEQLRRLSLDGTRVTRDVPLFQGRFGRLRSVVEGPDGALYVLTNNTDGRGSPREGDDRLLRVVPSRR
jgi:glucose/arabinose dehydrogenase